MAQIKVKWKVFNVSTKHVEEYLRANFPDYTGSVYNIHGYIFTFDDEPKQKTKDDIMAYWDGLKSNSKEARKYVSNSTYTTALKNLIDNFDYSKNYSELSINERKLLGNMDLERAMLKISRKDLGLEPA